MFYQILAWVLAWPPVADWLIRRAQRTPYRHIMSPDGGTLYMGRWWLFNPYDETTYAPRRKWCPISIRVHHIARADEDRHLHDHPWDARTFILRGAYCERRELGPRILGPGDTAPLRFGEFHRITDVSARGVWTLFVTGKYRGTWGFLVDGVKVPYRQYLRLE